MCAHAYPASSDAAKKIGTLFAGPADPIDAERRSSLHVADSCLGKAAI
jgi:hypothetical protein